MCRRLICYGLAVVAAMLATPHAALALTAQGQIMMHNWAASDRCTAMAQRTYPDYTAESLAKRDAALKQCLGQSFLAPRAPEAPEPASKQ